MSLGTSTFFRREIAVIDEDVDAVWFETVYFRGYGTDPICLTDIRRDSEIDS